MTAWLAEMCSGWSAFYGNHTSVAGAIRFLHLAGLVVGGGTALAADRLILSARKTADGRARILVTLAEAHRVVLPSLALVGLSGVLMFAADVQTFMASSTYFAKMATVAVLFANGGALQHSEKSIRTTGSERSWRQLTMTAWVSSSAWLLALLLGVWLSFAA
jgi:hypothetical protein